MQLVILGKNWILGFVIENPLVLLAIEHHSVCRIYKSPTGWNHVYEGGPVSLTFCFNQGNRRAAKGVRCPAHCAGPALPAYEYSECFSPFEFNVSSVSFFEDTNILERLIG